MKHPKGTALVSQIVPSAASESGDSAMQAMVLEMPLSAPVNYGRITPNQLKEISSMLNE